MNALASDMDRGGRHFQIVIRLQMVRAQVQELRRAGMSRESFANEELLVAIQGVVNAARGARLMGLTFVCLAVCERVELGLRGGSISAPLLALILDWAARAELYVRRPRFAEFAHSLVRQLGEADWGIPFSSTERDRLINAMLDPGL